MNTKFKDKSIDELINIKKKLALLTGILIGTLLCLLIITVYNSITKEFTALVCIPFALSPIVIMNLKQISTIKKELKSRE